MKAQTHRFRIAPLQCLEGREVPSTVVPSIGHHAPAAHVSTLSAPVRSFGKISGRASLTTAPSGALASLQFKSGSGSINGMGGVRFAGTIATGSGGSGDLFVTASRNRAYRLAVDSVATVHNRVGSLLKGDVYDVAIQYHVVSSTGSDLPSTGRLILQVRKASSFLPATYQGRFYPAAS